jgi:hypothetical protein
VCMKGLASTLSAGAAPLRGRIDLRMFRRDSHVSRSPVRSQSAAGYTRTCDNQCSQRAGVHKPHAANAVHSIKRPGGMVRDEEVVGSNPATPTRKQQFRALIPHRGQGSSAFPSAVRPLRFNHRCGRTFGRSHHQSRQPSSPRGRAQ